MGRSGKWGGVESGEKKVGRRGKNGGVGAKWQRVMGVSVIVSCLLDSVVHIGRLN